MNTAGDGFVATFISPSAALDCAEEIVDAVARWASRCGSEFMRAK